MQVVVLIMPVLEAEAVMAGYGVGVEGDVYMVVAVEVDLLQFQHHPTPMKTI